MSIGLIVTRGFGNGSLIGTIKDVVIMGYSLGVGIPNPTDVDDLRVKSINRVAVLSLTDQTSVLSINKLTVRSIS